jgi:5-methylcytosine-specific restriction endonuclease McrA
MDRALEQLVWQRASARCEYCRMAQQFDDATFQIDHIIADSHGGPTQADNLCLACFTCNHYKGPNISGIDDATHKIVPLFNPRRQKWARHFQWHGPHLVGRTAAGRATVATLRINLDYRLAHRQMLIAEGIFPPP